MKNKKITCIYKLIFSFFCLLLFYNAAFAAKPQEQKYQLQIDGRPFTPPFYPHLQNYDLTLTSQGNNPKDYPIPVTRHHIIPSNVLRDFYNTAVEKKTRIKTFRRFFISFAQRIPYYLTATRAGQVFMNTHPNEVQGVISINKRLGAGTMQSGGERPPAYYDDFKKFYAWMPWNLFIGPSGEYRTDDPGPEFESNAKYIVNNICVWRQIEKLYRLMVRYTNNPCERNQPNTFKTINRLLSNLLISRRTPYRLKAQQWVRTHNSAAGKPQYHIRITHCCCFLRCIRGNH